VEESGDDESLVEDSWTAAAAYIQVSRMMGIRMNAKKQMVGTKWGEYLQRGVSEDAPIRQSLASLLATLTTGNWYRPTGTWVNSALDTCCSNWLEAVNRGLPRTVAARMCGMQLDNLMIDRWTEDQPSLRWRQHARHHEAGKVLFADCPGYGDRVPPDMVVRSKPRPNWMSHGVTDYFRSKEGRWLLGLLDKEWMVKQWKDSVAFDTHASTEMGYHREETSRLVCERWQKGSDFVEVPLELPPLRPAPGLAATVSAWHNAVNKGRAVTEEDNLAALGLGSREVTLLGGYDTVVANLEPKKLARIKPLAAPMKVELDVALDTGLRAALALHLAASPKCGIVQEAFERRHVTVIAACNGARISSIARRFNQNELVRFDRLAAAWCGQNAYERGWDGENKEDAVRECARTVASKLAHGARPRLRAVLCHERPDIISEALRRQGIESSWVLYTPDETERMRRVQAREIAPSLLRKLTGDWRALYRLAGYAARLEYEEEVVQVVHSNKNYAACAA
jgi:hypothetical protein